jgi:signal peptidase I
MRTLSKGTAAVRWILDAVLILLILVVVFGVVLAKVVPLTGNQTIIVGGKSMEPAIGQGSAIIVAPVPAAELRVGDVVSLRAGPERALFTHRIVEVQERSSGVWVQTKGDANDEPDPTAVPASAIEGRVAVAIPLAGYLIALLSIPTGVLFLIGLAATLLAAVWLLESLELDRVDRYRVGLPTEIRPGLGEPISARPASTASLAVADGVYGARRLTVAEQISLSRSLRAERRRWQSAGQDASDSALD